MRIKAITKYKGTAYYGWQKQINQLSVQTVIEEALNKVLNASINITASGRTDAGVHACGQVFHFDIEKYVDLEKLKYSLNCVLPHDISIVSLESVSIDFHARFSAKGKHYRYIISFNEKDPFKLETTYNCLFPTDISLVKKAIKKFEGKHDFKNFTSKEEDNDNFVREIYKIETKKNGNDLIIDLYANGFMRYMIRFLVGTSLAIGWGKENLSYIDSLLDSSEERHIVSYKAPPQGLYLMEVIY